MKELICCDRDVKSALGAEAGEHTMPRAGSDWSRCDVGFCCVVLFSVGSQALRAAPLLPLKAAAAEQPLKFPKSENNYFFLACYVHRNIRAHQM